MSSGSSRLVGYARIMRRPHLGVRRRARTAWLAVADRRYWRSLRRLDAGKPAEYSSYLDIQLRRTLLKRSNDPGVGTRVLIDRATRVFPGKDARVLCIGCRNLIELDECRARGFTDVVGVDLFSQRSDIQVMDMHELTFADDSFDIVYCSHSLEHSYNVDKVASEIARVARKGAVVAVEVPVRGRASAADRIEFAGIDAVRDVFRRCTAEEIEAEEHAPRTETNGQGSDIARLVFRVEKAPSPLTAHLISVRPSRRRGRVSIGVAAVMAVLLIFFGLLPEVLGDWPYNAYGKDTRHTTRHHHAPANPHISASPSDVN